MLFNRAFGREGLSRALAVAFGCLLLSGCQTDQNLMTGSLGSNAAHTIAFESIDGPPQPVFQRLVKELSAQAETRKLPVVSRTNGTAWRVRLYLAAHLQRKQATISWVGDVFDPRYDRAFRVSGEDLVGPPRKDVWSLADDAVLAQIAMKSLDAIIAQMSRADSPQDPALDLTPEDRGSPVAVERAINPIAFAGPHD
jgi:hypothetical protein